MPNLDSSFREDARFRILSLLRESPELSQRQIARQLGISLGGVNYCLKGLIEKGQVKIENVCKSDNKLKYVYLLTPDGVVEKASLTKRFLTRRMREYDALKAEIAALEDELGKEVRR